MADPTSTPTSTQTMVTTIGATVAKNILMIAGASLASHGLISGSGTETFVSLGMVVVGAAWSFWNSYGRAILVAKLEVWKAKAQAQAEAMRKASVPQPTPAQIADKIPDPKVTAETVAKVVTAGCLALFLIALAAPAVAQTKRPPLTGDLIGDIKNAAAPSTPGGMGDRAFQALAKPFQDIAQFIGDDADAAIALATAVPEIQDGHGQQCWIEMASFGKIAKAHPVPLTLRVMTDVQALRLLAMATNKLCTNVHCTQVFADVSAMAQAASPVPLLIPTLHDLCTKVPQIAIVDPVTVPVPAAKP